MRMKLFTNLLFILIFFSACTAQNQSEATLAILEKETEDVTLTIEVGAEQVKEYLQLLKNKKVGVVANHTSMIDDLHLVDSLLNLKVDGPVMQHCLVMCKRLWHSRSGIRSALARRTV